MAYLARTVTPANGSQTAFPISFAFQSRAEVGIYVYPSGSEGTPGAAKASGVDFDWTSDGSITFRSGHVPAAGTVVDARRQTKDTALDNTIGSGGSLNSSQLAQNDKQLLYLAQELEDTDVSLQNQIVTEVVSRQALDGGMDERIVDVIAAALKQDGSTQITYNDTLGTITIYGKTPTNIYVDSAPAPGSIPLPVLIPENFGANPDQSLFDNGPALNAMAATLSALGTGKVVFKQGGTYWVGAQALNGVTVDGTFTWAPVTEHILHITGCSGIVIVDGAGAKIKCIAGLKYGAYKADGTKSTTPAPYFGADVLPGNAVATPYSTMVRVDHCTGFVVVKNLELDGNIKNQNIGGPWGDVGRQLNMTGIAANDNTGTVLINGIISHDHGLDAASGNGPGTLGTIENVIWSNNHFYNCGRQSFSFVGGIGWSFLNNIFDRAAYDLGAQFTSPAYSPPGSSFDMEAEGHWITDALFIGNKFIGGPYGTAFVSDTNSFIARVTFKRNTFIGTANWSVWADNPGFVWEDCLIIGKMTHIHADTNPALAAQFKRCRFTDDPTLSPTGTAYGNTSWFFDVGGGVQNILFERCSFVKTQAAATVDGNGAYGLTTPALFFRGCSFVNLGGALTRVAGIFSGEDTYLQDLTSFPGLYDGPNYLYGDGIALDSFTLQVTGRVSDSRRWEANWSRQTDNLDMAGTAAPTSGTFAKGAKVRNSNPTASGYVGWICTVAGSPGTWKGYGAIAA